MLGFGGFHRFQHRQQAIITIAFQRRNAVFAQLLAGAIDHIVDQLVGQLLGGGVGDMGCYASLACYREPDLVRAAVRRAIDAGFSVLKLHESTMAAIRAARASLARPGNATQRFLIRASARIGYGSNAVQDKMRPYGSIELEHRTHLLK